MPNNTEGNSKKSILDESFSIQTLMQGSDSYKSLIYGIVTVVVLFVVIALGVKSLSQSKAEIDDQAATTQNTIQKINDTRYSVQEGETLWSIAEKSYNDGFKWNVIASANNISDPTSLSTGTKLIIPQQPQPEVKPEITQQTMAPPTDMKPIEPMMVQGSKITSATYTVVHGDNLWDVAVRAYGDGYRWTDIANANKLANPGLIFSGNVLTLPRP